VNGNGENYSGQDVTVGSGFGQDDGTNAFYDDWPSQPSNMGGGDDFSSAVWVLIKFGTSNMHYEGDTPS
jgi:hypothetical protein